MTESESKSSSHASLKEKSPSQPENGKSENNMSSESVENGLKDGIKDDEINENHSKTADESTVQQAAAKQGNTEGSTEETDGNEDKEGNNTTNGSAEKTGSENGNENNIPTEAKSEEKVSQPEVGGNTNTDTEKATIDAAEVETLAATANYEDASEQSKEISNEDVSGDIGGKIENTEKVNVANSGGKVAENVEEGLTNDTGGVEGVKVDSEVENKDKDEHLGDKDSGHQDDEKPTASTTESEVVESGRNESEENERKEDEGGSKTVGEGKNDDDAGGEGNENIGEIEKAESKQDESKGGEIAECQEMKDGAKGVDEGHTDTAAEKSTEERSESKKKTQNKGSDEALVGKATENSSEDLSNKETVEKDGKDTPDKTAAVEPEIAVGPVANFEGNHESHSQVSSPDDNKSEVPSENIDDLVDEILAATDDVDAGKRSEGSESNAKAEEPVVTNESSEKSADDGQPVVTSESVEKSANDVQPVVTSENSEKNADDDQPMVISESSEKNEDGGPVSGGGQEGESSAQAEQTSSDHFHVSDIKEKDANRGEQTEQRVGSGNTVYRVQTEYLTRQVIAKQEKEMYLEEKLNETSRDLEIAERKVKDLQLRLKRFVKDDEAKDQKMRQMDREYKDLADQMQRIEDSLDSKSKNNNVGEVETQERQRKKSSSKVCVVL